MIARRHKSLRLPGVALVYVFSLIAASWRNHHSAQDFLQLPIRNSTGSAQSLEEGEFCYSSDDAVEDLEEGEIRDYSQQHECHANVEGSVSYDHDEGRRHVQEVLPCDWRNWKLWGPTESWNGEQDEELEEGEIRESTCSQGWQMQDWNDVDDADLMWSDDMEDLSSSPSDKSNQSNHPQSESGSSQRYSTTTDCQSRKKTSLVSDILSRPAMPLVPSRYNAALASCNSSQATTSTTHQRSNSSRGGKKVDMFAFDSEVESMSIRARQKRQRKVLDEIWKEKGINYTMKPEEVALKVAEIKIEYGHDLTIGSIASFKVQRETNEDYFEHFQLASRSFSRRLTQQRMKLKTEPQLFGLTEEEQKRYLKKQVPKYEPRQYGERKTKTRVSMQKDMELNIIAKEVWELFMTDARVKLNNANLQAEDLTVAQIEELSRDAKLRGDQKQTVELLKRYMARFLHKNPKEIKQFSINRLHHRYQVHTEQQSEKERRRREEMGLAVCRSRRKKKVRSRPANIH